MMLYAKVALGLGVEGSFDYLVPEPLKDKISVGKRLRVNFSNRKRVGFCVGLTRQSRVKYHKPVLEVIDEFPILSNELFLLAQKISAYYCCSWGQVIGTALPERIRKGKKVTLYPPPNAQEDLRNLKPQPVLLHDLTGRERWNFYLERIKAVLEKGRNVIVILPRADALTSTKKVIESALNTSVGILYRHAPDENAQWERIACGKQSIVVGLRSAIFAPQPNLGLIIIDEEEDAVYKQDQVPHYHARTVALMRSEIERAELVLGSVAPSVEAFFLAEEGKLSYRALAGKSAVAEIKFIQKRKEEIFSRSLEDAIYRALTQKEKILLFINRKGYSGQATCLQCHATLKCPRCNVNLVYHFQENQMKCHYCNFKTDVPKICPACNSGYLKFSGMGTEKLENELARIFPQAKILRIDGKKEIDWQANDIFVATSAILKERALKFDLTAALGIDNSLNLPGLRGAEGAFAVLSGLLSLTQKKLIIQTSFVGQPVFQALWKNKPEFFYAEELRQRRQLKFPPYSHFVAIKLRGPDEKKVKESAERLFAQLGQALKKRSLKLLSLNPAMPPKLRGNFYWQILARSSEPARESGFLKKELKKFRHSGIIVTVDVDPL